MTLETWPSPHSVNAVTVALEDSEEVDMLDLATPTGVVYAGPELAFSGIGTAVRLALPRGLSDPETLASLVPWLAAVPHDDHVHGSGTGTKVTALGALAFDPSAPGWLTVPHVLFGRDRNGRRWATVVGSARTRGRDPLQVVADTARSAAAETRRLDPGGNRAPDPQTVSVRAFPDGNGYRRAVARAIELIGTGRIVKVVLARTVVVDIDRPPRLHRVLARLRQHEPACTVFSFGTDEGTFLGASPELLVRRRESNVTSMPLAGTMAIGSEVPRTPSGSAHPLETSEKDHAEHDIVVDAVVSTLRAYCDDVALPEGTVLVQLGSLAHLGTRVHGTLRTGHGVRPSALELAAALHPTPAVGGSPRPEALDLIAQLEPASRGQWAGPVGWVDAAGDGEWMVGIRSATIVGQRVTMTAGAGIVSGSDPDAELAETTVKFGPVLAACCPGSSPIARSGAQGPHEHPPVT